MPPPFPMLLQATPTPEGGRNPYPLHPVDDHPILAEAAPNMSRGIGQRHEQLPGPDSSAPSRSHRR